MRNTLSAILLAITTFALLSATAGAVEITTDRYGFKASFDDPDHPGRWSKKYDTKCGDRSAGARTIQFLLKDKKTYGKNQARTANIRICAQTAPSANDLKAWCEDELARFKTEYASGYPIRLAYGSKEEFTPLADRANILANSATYKVAGQGRMVTNVCAFTGRAKVLITASNFGTYEDIKNVLTGLVLPNLKFIGN